MFTEFECKKCGEPCEVDGDSPKWFAWCHECNDYAEGFDASEHEGKRIAGIIDAGKERRKYGP